MSGRTADHSATPLDRSTYPKARSAPVRIVHIGLGAFHRAHEAWYTNAVDSVRHWGIAAFTGRSPVAANDLAGQDGLYTLVTRGPDGDEFAVLDSIVAAYDGADLTTFTELVAAPSTAIISITVTEAGYGLDAAGNLDRDAAAPDLAILRDGTSRSTGADAVPAGMPARLVAGLAARRRAGSGPIAVMSCDNLAANGAAARTAIRGIAAEVDGGLDEWIGRNVSFVDTSIDRITPRTTDADRAAVRNATGYDDASPVVTEPFSSWVIAGDFPAGRPPWEDAGAMIVDKIDDFERRKLWLLNGAHSLLAYAGSLRGHVTVAEAQSDPVCSAWVEEFWDEAARHLPAAELKIPDYREALRDRFANARIAHQLAQIATDGSTKLPMRAVPVLRAERDAGRPGIAAARIIGAWISFAAAAATSGTELADAGADSVLDALRSPRGARTAAMVRILSPELAGDPSVVELVDTLANHVTEATH